MTLNAATRCLKASVLHPAAPPDVASITFLSKIIEKNVFPDPEHPETTIV